MNEIHYATEARHYSYLSFVSLIWFYYFCFSEKAHGPFFFALSFLFLNAHFFSFPLVGFAYLYLGYESLKRSRPLVAARELASVAFLFAITILINYPSLDGLLRFTHISDASIAGIPLFRRLLQGASLVLGFWNNIGFFPLGIVFGIVLSAMVTVLTYRRANAADRVIWNKILLLSWVALPATLVLIRIFSSYQYFARYYLPYTGIGFVFLVFSVRAILRANRLPTVAGLFLLFCPIFLSVPNLHFAGVDELKKKSAYYDIYQKISESNQGPTLIVASPHYGSQVDLLYFNHFTTKSPSLYLAQPPVTDGSAHLNLLFDPKFKEVYDAYFQSPQHSRQDWIILHKIQDVCPVNGVSNTSSIEIRRYNIEDVWFGQACLWTIRGVNDTDTLREIALNLGFPFQF